MTDKLQETTTSAPDDGNEIATQTASAEQAARGDEPDPVGEETPAAALPTDPDEAVLSRQYAALAGAVLDSAELATRSAEAAVTTSENLKQATAEIRKLSAGAHNKAMLIAVASGVLMLLSLVFFLMMAVRLNSRVNQLDTMLLAVGKRAVELNTGLEALQDIDAGIRTLIARHDELARVQAAIEARVESALKQSETLVQQVPGATAKQVAESGDSVAKQVGALTRQLQGQAGTLQSLNTELKSLRSGLAEIEPLRRDLARLLQQRAERAPDSAQKSSAAALRERTVHYPRVPPRNDAEAATTPPGN